MTSVPLTMAPGSANLIKQERMAVTETDLTTLSDKIWTTGARREDLVKRVSNVLREQIVTGRWSPGTKLPPESEVARQLGISRPSLREALRILAHEQLIVVKHGLGTFVSKETKHMLGSLELMRSMTDLIRASGGEPSHRDLKVELVLPSESTAQALELDSGQKVGLVSRVRMIDDTPFVLAEESVVLTDGSRSFETLSKFSGESLYEFLRTELKVVISHSVARISAVAADSHMAHLLNLRKGAPLLLMHELHFGFDGKPVLLAVNYHNTAVVEFTSMRSGVRA